MSGTASDDRAQQWVRDRLAAEPRPELPADVRAGLDAVIVAESQRRAAAPPAPRRSRSTRPWLLVGAAAAVVVLAGIVVVPRFGSQPAATTAGESAPTTAAVPAPESDGSDCAVAATPNADLTSVLAATGTTYTAARLRVQARGLLASRAGCASNLRSSDTGPALDPAAISGCVVSVAAGDPVLAVDTGWYGGTRAVVALVRVPPTRALVLDCSARPVVVLASTDLRAE